jgi:hypothetical protein
MPPLQGQHVVVVAIPAEKVMVQVPVPAELRTVAT